MFRNFHKQLSPDAYFVNAMWHVLTAVATAATGVDARSSGPRRVIFHVFSQRPPRRSWTGSSKVPLDRSSATYVDELGCASSLRLQLLALAAGGVGRGPWELRLHLDTDTVSTLLHMAHADALVASDSSFSLAAAVLSSGLVLSMERWKRFTRGATAGIRFPLALASDGSFDCAEGARQWRRSRRARRAARGVD